MNIHLCTNVIKKYFFFTFIHSIKSVDIVIIHMSDYQVTMYDLVLAYSAYYSGIPAVKRHRC